MDKIILMIYFYLDSSFDNNKILQQYVSDFQGIKHPSDTLSVAFHKGVHGAPGNGSNCYFFVAEIRESNQNKNTIETFYQNQGITILFLENGEFSQQVPYGFNKLETWDLSSENVMDNLYLVYTLNTDFDNYHKNTFDMRCQ